MNANAAKALTGGLMVAGGAGTAIVAYAGGVIWFLPIAIGLIGAWMLIDGLLGDDGVW